MRPDIVAIDAPEVFDPSECIGRMYECRAREVLWRSQSYRSSKSRAAQRAHPLDQQRLHMPMRCGRTTVSDRDVKPGCVEIVVAGQGR